VFRLDLPSDSPSDAEQPAEGEKPAAGDVVVRFPSSEALPAEVDKPQRAGIVDRLQPQVERFTAGWRAAWVGDGVLGMRPRPVADLARQFWISPPAYIRDAWLLRIPYAIYGVPVIAVTAAAHLLLLIISYPSLLAGTGLLVLFVSLFL
jgi:hypothetical protein